MLNSGAYLDERLVLSEFGQERLGGMAGTVTDPHGALVAGATVKPTTTNKRSTQTATVGCPWKLSVNGQLNGADNITLDGINVQDNLLKSNDGFFESSAEGAVQIRWSNQGSYGGHSYVC